MHKLVPDSTLLYPEMEQHWQEIYENMACAVVVWNAAKQLISANAMARQILGLSWQEMQAYIGSREPGIMIHLDGTPFGSGEEWPSSTIFRTGEPARNFLMGFKQPDGACRWIQGDGIPLHDGHGTVTHVVISFVDVTERVEAEQRARESEERLQAILSNLPVMLTVIDRTGLITLQMGDKDALPGQPEGRIPVVSVFDLYRDTSEALECVQRALAGESFSVQIEVEARHYDLRMVPLRNQRDEVTSILCVTIDITERTQAEERLLYQAQHDALTDLPNRASLLERCEKAFAAAGPEKGSVALLMMDLDRFKDINDTFGHQHGDILLQQVAERLVQTAGAAATVARLGGDEFAILLPRADKARAQQTAQAIHTALEASFSIRGYPLRVETSVGIVLYPEHGLDALTLLRRADMALYTAKHTHNGYAFYDAAFDQYSPRRLALTGALRSAIMSNQLMLYYQPKADARTGLVRSVEALLRWQHPTYGFVPPDQFIPLAEQTGLITPLTIWVLETALRQCRDWLRSSLELGMAVNLSMWNLRDESLPDTIATLLKTYGISPHLLSIELTESAVMVDTERTLDVLTRLSALGVQVSVDDFGTGYSSLFYLKRLPVNELKIDRSFVQHMNSVESDAAIVRSTIQLAHSLGLNVVAEGVEDQDTMHLLATLGCDTVQGYYLSRPQPAQDFESWLRQCQPCDTSV